jgi:hypothetical protein
MMPSSGLWDGSAYSDIGDGAVVTANNGVGMGPECPVSGRNPITAQEARPHDETASAVVHLPVVNKSAEKIAESDRSVKPI